VVQVNNIFNVNAYAGGYTDGVARYYFPNCDLQRAGDQTVHILQIPSGEAATNSKVRRAAAARTSALQTEIAQRRPFRSPAEEASLGIMRTASLVRRAITKVVAPFGITQPQYNVLRILRGAGIAGLPTLTVRDRLVDEAPGITRLVNKLERAGLIRRERSTPDQRQVICYITKKGLALLTQLDPLIVPAGETGATGLSVAEQRTLIRTLDAVRRALVAGDAL
jgi:DNA-binding MarR family transcriptional regulator